MQLSITGVGAIVTAALTLLRLFGVDVPAEAGGQITEGLTALVGVALLVWGQLRRKDLVAGIIHKK